MWPARPTVQATLQRTHLLLPSRCSTDELCAFRRVLDAADQAAAARHAQRMRERDSVAKAPSEDVERLFDALIAVVEVSCDARCPLPVGAREARVAWAADCLSCEVGLVRRPLVSDSKELVRKLAAQLLEHVGDGAAVL